MEVDRSDKPAPPPGDLVWVAPAGTPIPPPGTPPPPPWEQIGYSEGIARGIIKHPSDDCYYRLGPDQEESE